MREGFRLELRNTFGLHKNPYTFGKSTIPESHHRATDVLREFNVACGAKCHKTQRRTGLRKHLATQCQVLNLDGKEIDTLAGLMDHSKTIHEKFYWLPSDVLQVAKVTKILLATDNGEIKNLGGKTLDEIDDKDLESAVNSALEFVQSINIILWTD